MLYCSCIASGSESSDFRYPETFTYSKLNSVGTSNYFHPQTLNGRLHCFPKGVLFGAVYSPFPRIIWSVFFWRKLISRYFLVGGFSNGKQAICMNFEDSKWKSQEGVIIQIWIKNFSIAYLHRKEQKCIAYIKSVGLFRIAAFFVILKLPLPLFSNLKCLKVSKGWISAKTFITLFTKQNVASPLGFEPSSDSILWMSLSDSGHTHYFRYSWNLYDTKLGRISFFNPQ